MGSRSHLPSVFFGGVEVDALTLRRALKLGSYSFNFDIGLQELTISGESGEIMRIECPYESARKLVTNFGCQHASDTCTGWSIYIPEPVLYANLSPDAAAIERALYHSGLPFKIIRGQDRVELTIKSHRYLLGAAHTLAELLVMIQEEARKYADVIALWKT